MSQEALGDACGIRFQQIQKYESAANRMSASMLLKLARALDVTPDYFYAGLLDGAVGARRPVEERRLPQAGGCAT